MKRSDPGYPGLWSALRVLPALLLAAGLSRADQPDETLPFFRPDGVYDMHGIDNVNLFNGDPSVVIPLGPEYLLGPTTRWQLKAYNTAKFWHYSQSCAWDPTARFAYVSGDPTLGVGWTLSPGYVEKGLSGWTYWAADGSAHRVDLSASNPAVTKDGSHLRIKAVPNIASPTSYTIEFPDGSLHVFAHSFLPPGGPFDFRTWDYAASAPTRFGLTEIDDPFGNKVIEVAYEDAAHPAEFTSIQLAGTAFGTSAPVISFSWTSFTGYSNNPWRVLDSILFPAPGGRQLKVKFAFQIPFPGTGTGFVRSNFDLPSPSCFNPPSSPSIANVPELIQIQVSDYPTADAITKTFSYFFSYYQVPAAGVQKQGTLATITLPSQQASPSASLATITYDYGITSGLRQITGSCEPYTCDTTSPEPEPEIPGNITKYSNYLDKTPAVILRSEFDPFRNATATVSYQRAGFFVYDNATGTADTETFVRRVTVIRPGNDDGSGASQYATQHFFHASFTDDATAQDGSNGIELERRDFAGASVLSPNKPVRDAITCYGGCGFEDAGGSVKRIGFFDRTPPSGAVTWFGARPSGQEGGTCSTSYTPACTAATSPASTYNAVAGRYEQTMTVSTLPGNVARTVEANWTAASPSQTDWLLDLYDHRFTWEGVGTTPPAGSNGSTILRQYFDFDATNGFLRGSWTWDSTQGKAIKSCRYNGGRGVVTGSFSQTYASTGEPTASPCPGGMPSIPSDSDTFGKAHIWTNLLLTGSNWQRGASTIGWNSFDAARDTNTGLITTARDPDASLATTYTHDALGRVVMIQPPGGSSVEWPTSICYVPSLIGGANYSFTPLVYVKKLRASPTLGPGGNACTPDEGAPSTSSGSFEVYLYDGFGRLVREIRRGSRALSTGSYFAMRETRYDSAGHKISLSDWQPCNLNGYGATSVAGCTKAQTSGARTVWSKFDPFGRAGEIKGVNGSNVASDVVIDRTDDRVSPAISFSDSKEKITTKCVNGAWSGAGCTGTGKIDAAIVVEKDALGRVTKVTEPDPVSGSPSSDTTSYLYNVLDKLTQVNQGSQVRTFNYYAFGFLKDESAPENGVSGNAKTDYTSYGSLGNLIVKRNGSPVQTQYNHAYDAAGRLTLLTTGATSPATYLVNCYDGTASCGDATVLNFAGGTYPRGKLTRRVGWNQIGFAAAPVYDDFAYSAASGRLSARTTSIGQRGGVLTATGFGAPVTQAWTYNSQGRMASHTHPRAAGALTALTINDADYTSGLLTRITAGWQFGGSQQLVTANYHESGRFFDYTTGSSATVKTTIAPEGLVPSRPGQISASTGAFNTGLMSYDGAGNIKSMGSSDTFNYDARSRIIQAKYGSPAQGFTYDRFGNLLTKAGATLCTGSCTNNRIAGAGYDDRGNMNSFGAEALSYDLLNRQISEINGPYDYSYLYDGTGERVGKFPRSSGAQRREIAHDIIEARGDTSLVCTPNPFSDVVCSSNPNDGKYIQKIKDIGITAGCGGGSFCPDATIPREQASVLLVKGKHCAVNVNGCTWAPPACAGRFADVPCPSTYADWIEQLSNDGVTAGCGGGNFCPSMALTSWQMLAWLKVYWPSYSPLPRSVVLTFRGENGKVTTESHQASATGDASDSVVFERDNVFLGNQLIASAIWSGTTPGWQFYSSDHLGTPRLTTNTAAATVETKKYWPYGDEASTTGNAAQRLKFAAMERDDEANHFYDHARSHDFNLGRFTSLDKVGGRPLNPQSWNRYAYTLGNPLKHIDLDGNVAIGFTGLFNSPKSGVYDIAKAFETHPELGPTRVFRHQDVKKALAFALSAYEANPDQPVLIFGHSRGAASSLELSRLLKAAGVPVHLLLTLDPVMIDPELRNVVPANVRRAVNYYEGVSSILGGVYLSGESQGTDVQNRMVLANHGEVDDFVAKSMQDLEAMIDSVAAQMRIEARKRLIAR